jgi:hypothetical protein
MDFLERLSIGVVGATFMFGIAAVCGWINNIIWTFHQTEVLPLVLGIVGIFVAPVGAVHGAWLWF